MGTPWSFIDPYTWNLPSPIYKYARREHAEALVHHGMVHLGTLDAYRDIERLGSEIGDDQEGFKRVTQVIVEKTGDMMDEFERLFFPGRNPGLYVANTEIGLTVVTPNCWLFCTSSRLSARLMRTMGYNTCVEIFDPRSFFRLIAEKLWSMHLIMDEARAIRCVYRERDLPRQQDDGLAPVRLKPLCQAGQAEIRMVYLRLRRSSGCTCRFKCRRSRTTARCWRTFPSSCQVARGSQPSVHRDKRVLTRSPRCRIPAQS